MVSVLERVDCTSLKTKQKRIPFWAFSLLSLNMSLCASAEAVSLKSITLASWRLLLYTNIMPPPPIPDECILTTPKQNMAAMAASTAEPLALRMSLPIWEHWGVSVAMACFSYGPPDDWADLSPPKKWTVRPTVSPTATSSPDPAEILMIVLQEKY